MKKSTLISTLAMVVIVALALTTATFAWYTSNSTVTATTTATAKVSNDSNLAITKGTATGGASSVDLSNSIQMMPLACGLNPVYATDTTGTKTTVDTIALWGGYTTTAKNEAGENVEEWTSVYNGTGNFFSEKVTITNMSSDTNDSVDLSLTVNWDSFEVDLTNTNLTDKTLAENKTKAKDALRIAIFNGSEGSAQLLTVLGSKTGGVVHYGEKADLIAGTGSSVGEVKTSTGAKTVVQKLDKFATIKGGSTGNFVTLTIVMYFDGVDLTQDYSGSAITGIEFEFTGTATETTSVS